MEKSKKGVSRLALVVAVAFWVVSPAAAADITPTILASACTICHGPDGASPATMPSIGGLEASVLATKLRDFKSGAQEATVMNRIAKGYSDSEIDALAKYFAAQRH